jgi:Fibronectin type III domain
VTSAAHYLNAGEAYSFKVSAENAVGEGPVSNSVTILAATVPASPNTPVMISQSPTMIRISWNIPNDGGSPLLGYTILFDGGIGSFTALAPTVSDALVTTYDITSVDHGIIAGTIYQFEVVAHNAVGQSSPSAPVSIRAATISSEPINLHVISSSYNSITFGWSAPVDNGGTPVTDYKVYWNAGIEGNSFGLLSSTTLGFITYTFQSGIVAGTYYEFKVVAKNAIGDSTFSTKLRVIAASVPDAPVSLALASQSKS